MTRLAKQAHEGTLNILVGGEVDVLEVALPVLKTFTENIDHVGALGFGHRMKLLHNYVSIGHFTVLAEAAANAAQMEVEPQVFLDVLTKGSGQEISLERLRNCMLSGDTNDVPFTIRKAIKDMNYYRDMVENNKGSIIVADSISNAIGSSFGSGHEDAYLP